MPISLYFFMSLVNRNSAFEIRQLCLIMPEVSTLRNHINLNEIDICCKYDKGRIISFSSFIFRLAISFSLSKIMGYINYVKSSYCEASLIVKKENIKK